MTSSSVELGEFVEIIMGQAPPGATCNKEGIGTVFVKAGEFQSRIPAIREWTTQPLKTAAPDDTLVCVVGATAGKVNYSAFGCAIGRSVSAVRPRPNRMDPLFLYHFLRTKVEQLRDRSQGAAQGVITREMIESLRLVVPPLPEQRRIAAVLDKADTLCCKRNEALAHLDQLAQAIFVEMFGDPVENNKEWTSKKLGALTSKLGSGATPTGGDSAYKDSGISLIRSLNVHDGVFVRKNLAFIDDHQAAKLSNVVVQQNDVLLNITGASVARVCLVPNEILPARVNQHVMIVRPSDELNPVFLESLLLNRSMKKKLLMVGGAGATREAITKSDAELLEIIVPPKSKQYDFQERMNLLRRLKVDEESSLIKLDSLFCSLQQRAFSGNL